MQAGETMSKTSLQAAALAIALTSTALPATVSAQEPPPAGPVGEQLAFTRMCNVCHALKGPRIGPPSELIALRWAEAKPPTVEILTQKVLRGGAGNWGEVPMVPNHNRVSEEEARTIVKWILGLTPQP